MKPMETFSPIVLATDPATMDGDGSFISPSSWVLKNPSGEAMLVDEFKFAIGQSTTEPLLVREHFQTLVNLRVGNSQLTNQAIPLKAFCPTYANKNVELMLSWHLSRPLYLPANMGVACTLSRRNPFPADWNSSPGTVFGFSILGRSLPHGTPRPAKVAMPWACATSCYDNTLYNSTTQTTKDFVSKDNEICNPFDSDLVMSYLCGASLIKSTTRNPPVRVLMQATYGSGKMLIRDPVPLGILFPDSRPLSRLRGLMKPHDFLKVVLSNNPIPSQPAASNQMAFTTVGLTGFRMIDTPGGP